MPTSVRVAGGHVDFSANTGAFEAGANRVIARNRQIAGSFAGMAPVLDRFRQSLVSSIIATGAYAAGIGALTRVTSGSAREFLQFERNLIAVQKTAGLTSDQTRELGDGIRRLVTDTSSLGRPLPIVRDELERIAVVAGQMNIRGTRDILAFTEVIGLLTLTTDLAGDAAANAVGKIIATTQSGVGEIQNLGSALTALGNAFRGGEADILSQAQFLATQTAAFQLPTQTVFGLSAALAAGGQRPETAGTAFARVLQALTDAASDLVNRGDYEKLVVITQNLEGEFENAREGAEDLATTILSGNYTDAITTFLRALRNTGADRRGSIFTTLLGGDVVPTRVAGIFNFLTENFGEVSRALDIANTSWREQIALLEEAGQFAEARQLRFLVVQNQLRDQALEIGDSLSSVYLGVAENFKVVEAAALSAGAAILTGFGRRRLAARREAADQRTRDFQERISRQRDTERDLMRQRSAAIERRNEVTRQNRILVNAGNRALSEQNAIRRQERRLEAVRTQRVGAERLAAAEAQTGVRQAVIGFGGGTVSAADAANRIRAQETTIERELIRAQNRYATTQRQIERRRGIFTGEAVSRQRQIALDLDTKLTEQQQRLNQTVSDYNAHLNRNATLLRRVGSGLLNLVGGPLGLLSAALTAGVAIWALWGDSADEATNQLDELVDQLDRAIEAQENAASGRSANLRLADETLRQITNQREIIERLQEELRRVQEETVFSQVEDLEVDARESAIGEQIREAQEQVERLTDRYNRLITRIDQSASSMEGFVLEAGNASQAVELIDRRLDLVGQNTRAFRESIEDSIGEQNRRLELDFVNTFASPFERDRNNRAFRINLIADRRLLQTRRAVRNAVEDEQSAYDSLNKAIANRNRLEAGTERFGEAQRQVTRLTNEHRQAVNNVVLAKREQELQEIATAEAVSLGARAAEDLARRARELQLEQLRRPPVVFAIPDVEQARRDADSGLDTIERDLDARIREFRQGQELSALDPVSAGALRERNIIRNAIEDQITQISDELVRLTQEEQTIPLRIDFIEDADATATDFERTANAREIQRLRSRLGQLPRVIAETQAQLFRLLSPESRNRFQLLEERAAEFGREVAGSNTELEQLAFRFLDAARAGRLAERELRNVNNQLFTNQRRSIQQTILSSVQDPVRRAGFAGRFSVLNPYEDALRSLRQEIEETNDALQDNRVALSDVGLFEQQAERFGSQQLGSIRAFLDDLRESIDEGERSVDTLTIQERALLGLRDSFLAVADSAQQFEEDLSRINQAAERVALRFIDLTLQQRIAERQFDDFRRQNLRDLRDRQQRSIVDLLGPEQGAELSIQFAVSNQFEDSLADTTRALRIQREELADATERYAFLQAEVGPLTAAEAVELGNLRSEQRSRIQNARIEIGQLEARIGFINKLRGEYSDFGDELARIRFLEESLITQRIAERLPSFTPADTSGAQRRALSDFRQVQRQVQDDQQEALRTALVEDSGPLRGSQLSAVFELERERTNALRDASDDLAESRAKLNDQIVEAERLNGLVETGDINRRRQNAEQLAQQNQRISATINEISETEAYISTLNGTNSAFQQLLETARDIATFQRNREIESILGSFEPPEPIDFRDVEREARRDIISLEDEIARTQREARQQNQLEGLSIRPAAGLARTFELQNQFDDRVISVRRQLSDVQQRLNEQTEEFIRLEYALGLAGDEVTNQELEAFNQKRDNIAQLEQENERLQALILYLEMAGEEYRELAEAAGELAASQAETPLSRLARSAQNLDDILESTTANALQNFENALVNVFRSGQLELDNLIEAIAIDLIQALIRATITANLARAALAAIGAIFGGGGGGGGGAGLESTLAISHSGGVVGDNMSRRSASIPLRSRERLVILEDGEEVLTSRDPRHRWNVGAQSQSSIRAWVSRLPRYHEGGVVGSGFGGGAGGGSGPSVIVNVQNESPIPVNAGDVGTRFDGESLITNILIRDMRRNGPITSNMRRSVLGTRA